MKNFIINTIKALGRTLYKFTIVTCLVLSIFSWIDRGVIDGKLPETNITLACGDVVDYAGQAALDIKAKFDKEDAPNYETMTYFVEGREDVDDAVAVVMNEKNF